MSFKRNIIAFCTLLSATICRAEMGVYNLAGMDTPMSGYGVATGEENISSHRDEVNMMSRNPAMMSPTEIENEGEEKREASLSFVNQVSGANSLRAGYMQSIDERQLWGAYFDGTLYGTMTEMDEFGEELGDFTANDLTFGGAYSRLLAKGLTAGVGVKFLYSQIAEYKAFALGFDVGLNYYNPEKQVSVSLCGRNIGAVMNSYTDTGGGGDRLPFNLSVGVSKTLQHAPLTFHVTYHNLNRWNLNYYKSGKTELSVLGEEWKNKQVEVKGGDMLFRHFVFGIDLHPVKTFAVSVSYNFRRNREFMLVDSKTGAGWCFGLMVDVRKLKVSAGYAISGRAANTFGVSVGYKFSDGVKRVEFEKMY